MVRVRDGRDRGQRLHCKLEGVVVELRPGDLSLSGVFLPGATRLEMEREVELELCSPIGELRLEALVVQVVPPARAEREGRDAGAGLLFLNLGDDQRAFIGLSLDAVLRSARAQPTRSQKPAPAAAPMPTMPKPVATSARPTPALQQPVASSARPAPATQQPVASSARPAPAEPSAPPRVPPPSRGPTPEQQKLLRELEQLLQSLAGKTPWAVLGLEPNAGRDAAKQAFFGLSKKYHPHLYARHDRAELSRAATELFIAYKKAFAAIEASPGSEACAERSAQAGGSGASPQAEQAPAESVLRATKTPTLPNVVAAPKTASASEDATRPLTIPPPPSPTAIKTSLTPPRSSGRAAPPPNEVTAPKSASASTVRPKPASTPLPGATRAARASQPPPAASKPTRASQPPPIGARRQADAELALAAGLKHLAAARYDAADAELERARALHPGGKAPELWLRVCRARKAKAHGRSEEAQRFYAEALEFDPEHREALEHAGGRDRRKRTGLIGKFFGPDDE